MCWLCHCRCHRHWQTPMMTNCPRPRHRSSYFFSLGICVHASRNLNDNVFSYTLSSSFSSCNNLFFFFFLCNIGKLFYWFNVYLCLLVSSDFIRVHVRSEIVRINLFGLSRGWPLLVVGLDLRYNTNFSSQHSCWRSFTMDQLAFWFGFVGEAVALESLLKRELPVPTHKNMIF